MFKETSHINDSIVIGKSLGICWLWVRKMMLGGAEGNHNNNNCLQGKGSKKIGAFSQGCRKWTCDDSMTNNCESFPPGYSNLGMRTGETNYLYNIVSLLKAVGKCFRLFVLNLIRGMNEKDKFKVSEALVSDKGICIRGCLWRAPLVSLRSQLAPA